MNVLDAAQRRTSGCRLRMAARRFSVAALEARHVVQLTFERDFETRTRAPGPWTEADVAVRTATISADGEFKIGELESLSMKTALRRKMVC